MDKKYNWAIGGCATLNLRDEAIEDNLESIIIQRMKEWTSHKIQHHLRCYIPCKKSWLLKAKKLLIKNDTILSQYKKLSRTPFRVRSEHYDKQKKYISFEYVDFDWKKCQEIKKVNQLEKEIKQLTKRYNKRVAFIEKKIKRIKNGHD